MEEENESQEDAEDTLPNYKLCLLYDVKKPSCGPYTRPRAFQHGLCYISNLNASTDTHFKSLKMQFAPSEIKPSERQLIENRLGENLLDFDQICEHHRHCYGVNWRPPNICKHPGHTPPKPGTKLPKSTPAPFWLVEQVNSREQFSFPIGGKICYKHWQAESNTKKELSNKTKEQTIEKESENDEEEPPDDPRDEDYDPGVPICPPDVQSSSKAIGMLLENLGLSPISVQVTQTSVRDISTGLRRSIERKIDQVTSKIKETIAESIAPTQGAELITEIYGPEDVPKDLKPLILPYQASDARGKLIILSLIDHNQYSKNFIQDIFGCKKNRVEKARKLQAAVRGQL